MTRPLSERQFRRLLILGNGACVVAPGKRVSEPVDDDDLVLGIEHPVALPRATPEATISLETGPLTVRVRDRAPTLLALDLAGLELYGQDDE